ncbi:hypothetical protein M406DRAFT_95399 [Cryphonectria parasitica EP155]|uniref:Nucleolar protein 9 n=1 Tax=Cryphonectria parasitica (strain ATCC 38755 / EP155) TaxID=660469 RepID=A0A9P4XZQ2_CRYP1|nr:uncharacterized protein M406DRAFT_95399 [Cryphonectria parasitica EP155]KAF3763859.1 hypothetical protein M406DRAFT_95399 [Cryphonectria parasitica EP155]
MGKERKSKRQLIRDEKKAKKRAREVDNAEAKHEKKRQRLEEDDAAASNGDDYPAFHDAEGQDGHRGPPVPEREFFGMLADEEQEYFRSADEKLETNDFDSDEDRGYFLQSLYREAVGKELKLASSQSCSRLMERLILLSNTKQKKRLFEAFAGHFVTLVTHRFASHCCEKLFIQSAPVVSRELGGMEEEGEEEGQGQEGEGEAEEQAPKALMEELFLLTLDELEEHLSYLLSDKFGSHALRVLLVVLSGRPLEQVSTKSLLQSKKKEHITVQGASADTAEMNAHVRVVPDSFSLAVQKILEDTTVSMDTTALRVLATHPTGNPVLQLLLELDMSLNGKDKEKKDQLLILKLLPGAPDSLADNATPASDFVNSMMYDPVGSRLLETIIAHAPAKIFKALNLHFFSPRIQTYVRNDIACYPAIKALSRMSKDDLKEAVQKIVPEMPKLVAAKRLNVLKALFDRCQVRQTGEELDTLLEALCTAYGSADGAALVPKLCGLETEAEADKEQKKFQPSLQTEKQKAAAISHGCQLATTLLHIPGAPAKAIQMSLLSLSGDQLFHLATSTTPSMIVIKTALSSPAQTPNFHKALVTKLAPKAIDLAHSQIGHNVVNAIVSIPSKARPTSNAQTGVVPFHVKETMMTTLAGNEKQLRETWTGRSVWRTWKGDQWKFRRSDWIRYAKEVDPQVSSEEKIWNRVADKNRKEEQDKKKGRMRKERAQ